MGTEPEFRGRCIERRSGGKGEGSSAQFARIEPESQMMHDRVADETQFEHVIAVHPLPP